MITARDLAGLDAAACRAVLASLIETGSCGARTRMALLGSS